MYVVMDGFDLGIGILFPFYKPGTERDAGDERRRAGVGRQRDLAGARRRRAAARRSRWPMRSSSRRSIRLIMAMLLGLVFRGVAFEFRWRAHSHRAFWDLAFSGVFRRSAIAGDLHPRRAAAGACMWKAALMQAAGLTGFRPELGAALTRPWRAACGYALLGACWMAGKLNGSGQDRAFHQRAWLRGQPSRQWPPSASPLRSWAAPYYQRWFAMPTLLYA